jgi:hypothetical protein
VNWIDDSRQRVCPRSRSEPFGVVPRTGKPPRGAASLIPNESVNRRSGHAQQRQGITILDSSAVASGDTAPVSIGYSRNQLVSSGRTASMVNVSPPRAARTRPRAFSGYPPTRGRSGARWTAPARRRPHAADAAPLSTLNTAGRREVAAICPLRGFCFHAKAEAASVAKKGRVPAPAISVSSVPSREVRGQAACRRRATQSASRAHQASFARGDRPPAPW